jgi:hypothetical protein
MIFSTLLTVILLGLIFYALLQAKTFPVVARTLPVVCTAGIYAAWFPDTTSRVAQWLGIGRGADLLLYIWIVISGLLILGLHLKLVTQDRRLTELARAIAIAGARPPRVELLLEPATQAQRQP